MFPALVRWGPTPLKSEQAVASTLGPTVTRPGLCAATASIAASAPAGIFVVSGGLGLGSQAALPGPRTMVKRSIARTLGYLVLMFSTAADIGRSQSLSAMRVQLSDTNTTRSGAVECCAHGETMGASQKGLVGFAHSSTY